jgi:hypothetical protein
MTDARSNAADASTDESLFLWYTVEKGGQAGPWSSIALRGRIAAGKVNGSTLVWTHGLSEWVPLESLEVFGQSARLNGEKAETGAFLEPNGGNVVPINGKNFPDIPLLADNSDRRSESPRPWLRWVARLIDIWVFVFLFGVASALLEFRVSENGLAFYAVAIGFSIAIETVLMATIGTTPGKALMNISVSELDGTALSWARALRRTINAWVRGEGLGIPIISLFTMVDQYNRLKATGATSYDQAGRFRISHGRIGGGRIAIVVSGLIVVIALASI